MVDAELAFKAVAGIFLAGELEDEGVDVEIYFLDVGDFQAFSVVLRTAVDGWEDDDAAGVGFEGVLLGLPCAALVVVLVGQRDPPCYTVSTCLPYY